MAARIALDPRAVKDILDANGLHATEPGASDGHAWFAHGPPGAKIQVS